MFSSDIYRNETLTPEALAFLNELLASDFELYYFVRRRVFGIAEESFGIQRERTMILKIPNCCIVDLIIELGQSVNSHPSGICMDRNCLSFQCTCHNSIL
ncbi:hypothetical protein LSH36_304g00021 [Paralvinella palmiformis]|uniref:Uncharacterized protein n=1 Tax=Paralvinella palmiformis TaxID=53620 RepID=A0AAD9N324_9ANNE|nr:hypothetical protein LSH36_304g00021 [Paralvinella palmiformis]